MKGFIIGLAGLTLGGCAIERISPEGLTLSRPYTVPTRDVLVFASFDEVPSRYSFVDEVWIKDEKDSSPEEMEKQLRVQAGARGANAIVMAKDNRRNNGTRVILDVRLDDPFDYFSSTAIWIGEGKRPVKILRNKQD